MKNILRNMLLLATAAVFGLAMSSCNDLDDLEDRVDALESRVTALETQIPALNSNIETLYNLLDATTIYSITESNGVYTITTTNGQTMTITQGAVGNTPLLSVDANGYWIVSYDDGGTYSQILVDGSPVMASTVYPQFSVDAGGYWLISYDKGATFEQVLDTSGNPVTALGEGSDLFKDITYDEASGILTVILTDGYTLEIIVTPDFYCAINDVDYNTPVAFETGVSRNFYVTMHGVSAAFVVVPEGWSATLGDPTDDVASLKVTPPSTLTKATANSDSDLSIFATSAKGYSTIAKMSLYLSDMPVPASPSVKIAAGEATTSTLEFTVTPNEDVTSWKYMLLLSSESAPSTDSDFDDAETSTETKATVLTFGELADDTEYVLYVLPINDDEDVTGDIAFAKNTTLEIVYDTYYEAYEAGKNIVIGDRTYNKETYGEASHITESGELTFTNATSGPFVVFIDPGIEVKYAYTGNIYKLVLIGNDPNKRSSFASGGNQFKLDQQTSGSEEACLVFYNLDLDISEITNYSVVTNRDGGFEYLAYVNCHVTCQSTSYNTKIWYTSAANRFINNLVISDCVWGFPANTGSWFLMNVSGSISSPPTLSSITITNNVFYCDGVASDARLFALSGFTVEKVVFSNNSLINLSSSNQVVLRFGTVNYVDVQKNIAYMESPTAQNLFFRPDDTTNYVGMPTSGIVYDNIAYYPSQTCQIFYGGVNKDWAKNGDFEQIDEITSLSGSPFEGGTMDFTNEIFIPNSTYSSYGAQQ